MSSLIFNNNDVRRMTFEEVKQACPYAFLTTPSRSKVSEKYVHLPTNVVMEDLGKLGWYPVQAKQTRATRKASQFSKHMIAFRNDDIMIKGENGDNSFPQIILLNSHDGLSSFKFHVGVFRMVCSNGLVIADKEFSNFSMRHKGYSFDELRKLVTEVIADLPNKVEILNKMSNTTLTQDQKEELALNALLLRKGITPGSEEASKVTYDQQTIDDILEAVRPEDQGDSLWKVFNVVQEKMIRGGFSAALRGQKVRKVKSIKSFQTDIKINQELFKLATSLAQ